jgi:exopolysaccharide biosynthesis polyprenyl glycosylphosphotransferase
MNSSYRQGSLILLLGDLFFFLASLWLALFLRNFEIPSRELLSIHLASFGFLFVAWILVFYIAGLYEKHTTILKSNLSLVLTSTLFVNAAIAVVFFYFIPLFGITPKTILFIYLFVSFALILFWRMQGYFVISRGQPNNAVIIGSGQEMKELLEEVNENPIYNLKFISSVDLDRADEKGFWDEVIADVYANDVSLIAIDLANKNVDPVLPHLYNLIFSKISFIDAHKIYEDIFDRVPISLLNHDWFLENISTRPHRGYDALKRLMDISVSFVLSVVSIVIYPFIILAIKLEDGGDVFIYQERVGKNNKLIKIIKFRTMSGSDTGEAVLKSNLTETKIGRFLRKTRIDELPQVWNILKGDLSLIGPRPELPALVKHYEEEVPFYNVRHLIKPGLSGWAQIYHDSHPHHGVDTEETKNKLSYDLYYIKNRSFLLDIKIALRTLKTLASIAGR